MRRSIALAAIAAFACSVTASACLWDYDTLRQERSRFPSTLELITGKFLRHSDEFYRWRIEDRQRKLESEPYNVALLDDMAVAWDKLGEPDKAIALMQQKDALQPDEYETLANLGTFHIHAGRLEEGAEFIRQAIEINPDAHFGREVYQLKLVEYVLSERSEDGTIPVPLDTQSSPGLRSTIGFAAFLASEESGSKSLTHDQHAAALKGVLGMMRFGHYDSPVLLEALGDLLASGEMADDGRQLAARAYLRASQEASTEEAATAFREKAESVAENQYLLTHSRRKNGQSSSDVPPALAVIESELAAELIDAEQWIAKVHEDERTWVATGSGVNPDVQFAELYAEEPVVATPNTDQPQMSPDEMLQWGLSIVVGCLIVAMIGGLIALRRFVHLRSVLRRQQQTSLDV